MKGELHRGGGGNKSWNLTRACERFDTPSVYVITIKIHSSCEIEDLVETHLCKLVGDTPITRITHICKGLLYA